MAALSLRSLVRFGRDTRGSDLLEFALVLPLLLYVAAGIIDMGFLFNNYETVTNAAREGARLAAIPGQADTDVQNRVNTFLSAAGLTTANATTTVTPVAVEVGGGTVNGVKVVVSYPYNFMALAPISKMVDANADFGTITLTASSTMRSEIAAGL